MTDPDTRDRLIDAAQELFSREGFNAASLRAITERAEVNLAAVSYHFGGKEGLLAAVVERVVAPINAERERRFAALEAAPGGGDLEAWVRAMTEPCFSAVETDRIAAVFGLIARIHLEAPEQLMALHQRLMADIIARFLARLTVLLPAHPQELLLLRLVFAGGAFGKCMLLFGSESACLPMPAPDPAVACEDLIAFTIGGLAASVSQQGQP